MKVAVVGASGYTGVELLRLLVRHPHVELCSITSRQYDGMNIAQVFPSLAGFGFIALQSDRCAKNRTGR